MSDSDTFILHRGSDFRETMIWPDGNGVEFAVTVPQAGRYDCYLRYASVGGGIVADSSPEREYDGEKTFANVKRCICELRRDGTLTAETARSEWDLLGDHDRIAAQFRLDRGDRHF